MSDIAKARQLLRIALASDEKDTLISQALGLMRREPAARRAPNQSRLVDEELAKAIIAEALVSNRTIAQIANDFNVNPGRVSEVINGLR